MMRHPRGAASSFLVSLAIHLVAGAALLQIVMFHIPLRELFDGERAEPVERLVYVPLVPASAPAPRGTTEVAAPSAPGRPATRTPAIVAPTTVPTTIPTTGASAGTRGRPDGIEGATGSGVATAATGVTPDFGDGRLWAPPGLTREFAPVLKSPAERIDSVVKSRFRSYQDSMRAVAASAGRAPGDWTVDRNGEKWGWDEKGVRLGKFTIPNYLLGLVNTGALQANPSLGDRGTVGRLREVREQADRAVTEDEFRASVKRVRERKERERREAEARRRERERPIAPAGGTTGSP